MTAHDQIIAWADEHPGIDLSARKPVDIGTTNDAYFRHTETYQIGTEAFMFSLAKEHVGCRVFRAGNSFAPNITSTDELNAARQNWDLMERTKQQRINR